MSANGVVHREHDLSRLPSPGDDSRRRELLERCDELIGEHRAYFARSQRGYRICHVVAIISGIVAPVLIVALDSGAVAKTLEAATSAAGGLCLALLGRFKWDRDYVRHAALVAKLKSERSQFATQTTSRYARSNPRALDNFSQAIESLYLGQITEFVDQTRTDYGAAGEAKPGDDRNGVHRTAGEPRKSGPESPSTGD